MQSAGWHLAPRPRIARSPKRSHKRASIKTRLAPQLAIACKASRRAKRRQDARAGLYRRRAGRFRPRRVPVLRRASREKRRLSLYSRGANGVGLQTPPGRQIDCGTLGGARIGAAKAYRDYSGNRAFGRLLSVGALARVRFRVALMYWTKPARVLDFHDGW